MDSGSIIQKARSSDFLVDVQKGNVAGHSLVHKFGRNDAVTNGVWEHVSLLSATTFFLSAATTVRIKAGGDAADTAAGNGAREIIVQGIDDSLNEVTETIATNGASASTSTSTSFWRIHRAWVSAAGTYSSGNTATITVENTAGTADLIMLATDEGQSQYAGWTVPTGKTAYLLTATITVDSLKPADIKLLTRGNFNDTSAPVSSKRLKIYWDGVSGELVFTPRSPGPGFAALTDIWWEAEGSGAVTEVSVDFELLVVDD